MDLFFWGRVDVEVLRIVVGRETGDEQPDQPF